MHNFEEDEDYNEETKDRLIAIFKKRFDGLLVHKLIYYHLYQPTERTIEELREVTIDDEVDCLGMNPFHILALSQKPSIEIFEELTNLYRRNAFFCKDKWGYLPIYYLCSNIMPEASALFERLFGLTALKRLKLLGLNEWKSAVSNQIDAFYSADTSDRIENMKQVYYLLEKYERREIISLLESALWKAKIHESTLMGDATVDREACRVNCGADIVISNVLPFLDPIRII